MNAKKDRLTTVVIYSEDKKGIVGQVLLHFNKRSFDVHSLNVARTDLSNLIVITAEVNIPVAEIETSLKRLKKIIEVVDARAFLPSKLAVCKVAHFQLAGNIFNNGFFLLLQQHGAQITSYSKNRLTIRKIGAESDIQILYNLLEGPELTGFCKSLLVQDDTIADLASIYEVV